MNRPTWDEVYMQIAQIIASRGTCPRAQVGAVLVDPGNRIISTGYNGAPKGMPHCTDVGCIILPNGSCGRSVHAEINAMMQAGPGTREATLYTTTSPCYPCAASIVNIGIVKVVFEWRYRNIPGIPDPVDFLIQCGVEVVHLPR